ncbi:MAG: AAA family ATPase [Candidatus Eremiobacteraeota bacterium]|nr:AAA family ATPase [Candidatus Eremiobacteraeota bacterium]MCL5056015.1 AAA family ATPase [Bacillota bacterium]
MISRTEQIIKVIDFWKKNAEQGLLHPRSTLDNMDLKSKEIVDLLGPRRSGKSSLLKLIARKVRPNGFLFINFEDPFFVENQDPGIIEEILAVFYEYYSPDLRYLLFDEIQGIPQWERYLRKLRDTEKYRIFVTGSSASLLSREIAALLTGRHLSYPVFPLSFKEFLQFKEVEIKNKKDLVLKESMIKKRFADYLQIGGFPEAVLTGKQELLKNYFFDIIQRDIMMRHSVRETKILEKVAVYTLTHSAKIISIEALKKTFDSSFALITAYLEYLKEAFLICELPQFSYSLKKQEKALKKIYAIDTGLAEWVSFKFSEDKGRMLENVVFLQIKRMQKEIYYYKTRNHLEIDFMIREKNKIQNLIQVSWTLEDIKVKDREVKSLVEGMKELKIEEGLILTYEEEGEIQLGKYKITIKPVYRWLLEADLAGSR